MFVIVRSITSITITNIVTSVNGCYFLKCSSIDFLSGKFATGDHFTVHEHKKYCVTLYDD